MPKKIVQPNHPLTSTAFYDLSGIFTTVVNGSVCQLELDIQPYQKFTGYLKLNGQCYEIRGVIASENILHGFVLEPFEHKPIALLRAHIFADEICLELDMPEDMVQYESKPSLRA